MLRRVSPLKFNPSTYKRCIRKILFSVVTILPFSISAQAVKTEVKQTQQGWQFFRNGQPYYVKGAGGTVHMKTVVACGGNSVRTWGVDNARAILDEAQKNGLTVMLGLWMQHERHGFDYNNKEKVKSQFNHFKTIVSELKDHPALLLWGVGNEVDLFYSNTNVWDAVNDVAQMIHETDPNHPTSTVTAGLDSNEVVLIKKKAPHIDIYGVNTYGDIGKVKDNIRKFGWNGPYMITEWGPDGHWESPQTEWGASIEQSSSEKANVYRKRYKEFISADSSFCVGSYVFLWGQKQEYTGTWYGMFSLDGIPTETIDAIHSCWKGKDPESLSPSVDSILINGKNKFSSLYLKSGDTFSAEVFFRGTNKNSIHWKILPESSDLKAGGDQENAPEELRGLIRKAKGNKMEFVTPAEEGKYRLFVEIFANGKIGYANIPFYVIPRTSNDPPLKWVKFKKQEMQSFKEP